jgi:hypothetical protein
MSKQKKRERQDERDIQRMEGILSGRLKVEYHEGRKRRPQPNRKGGAAPTGEEESEMMGRYAALLRALLPGAVAKLSRIEDPRDQNRIEHSLPVLMLFGILMFLSHCKSRREANRDLARGSLLSLVGEFVPGAADMPHADTLARLLKDVGTDSIDRHYEGLVEVFIQSSQFRELNPGRFLVAVDGTQKFALRYPWDARALSRNAGDEEKERHCAYALESVLILENGMLLPLLTEILENPAEGGGGAGAPAAERKTEASEQAAKQDCETKAFHRLAQRLEKMLGKGRVTVVLDGIYASGPVVSRCQSYGWGYMIVLKKDSLKTVWEDFNGLQRIEKENALLAQWGERGQAYRWSNGLEYTYGGNHKKLTLNVVTCTETWEEAHPRSGGKPKAMVAEYAWLSSECLDKGNVFRLCTKVARARWRIENGFLVEKHQGYQYSHRYSYNWDVMKGFHYLMKFGIFLNVFITHCESVALYVSAEGIRGFVKRVWEAIRHGRWPAAGKTGEATGAASGRKRTRFPKLRKSA